MMDDKSINNNDVVAPDSRRTWRRLWPVVAAVVALPVVGGAAGVLLLWSVHLWNVPLWAVVLAGVPLTLAGSFLVWRLARSCWVAPSRYIS